ncbi:MAG TPA: FkbM family methyltransferase [Pyrinomonadaceae bacterium]|nr:FkbM family methyltransferase [Pyrinomonadaceae bacterium]
MLNSEHSGYANNLAVNLILRIMFSTMQQTESSLTRVLKRILFRPAIKHPNLQHLWSRLHTIAIFGMNYGGGGLIESSGEKWVLENVVSKACRGTPAVIFDVGANVGDYSLMLRNALPSATIFAFEPATSVYLKLVKRLTTVSDNGIRPFNIGFSDTSKEVDLYSYSADGNEASVLSSIDLRLPTQVVDVKQTFSERINVETIDNFCETQGIARIDFLKLDVEGHEIAILRGARRMLAEDRISMIQFEFGPANIYSRTYFYDFWSILSERFDMFRIIPQGIVPISFYGEHREVFLTSNYLALRKRNT